MRIVYTGGVEALMLMLGGLMGVVKDEGRTMGDGRTDLSSLKPERRVKGKGRSPTPSQLEAQQQNCQAR